MNCRGELEWETIVEEWGKSKGEFELKVTCNPCLEQGSEVRGTGIVPLIAYCLISWTVWLNWGMYNVLLCIIRVSGIFQKPPGGRWTAARRLIQFLLVSWVPERNRLAVSVVPPGDTWRPTQILGFWLNCLAVMNTRQVTRTNFGSVLVFWVFWLDFKWKERDP